MTQPLLNFDQRRAFESLANSSTFAQNTTPSPGDRAVLQTCSVDRVMKAGGEILSYVTPESIVPFEAVYRRLPVDGIFEATPHQPVQFDMGFFQVPQTMALVLLDWRFDIYRPSGSAAGDYVPLEPNRLSTQVGWNIKSNARVQGNYHYELSPIPPAAGSPSYQSNPNPGFIPGGPATPATDDQFSAARALSAQSATGDLSILPQRHHRQGLMPCPAPWCLHSSSSLTISCHVFRAIQIPIAFFEAEVFGFLLPDQDLLAIQKTIQPCIQRPGGI